jgi:3-hydroxyisobutyrate dehydrogenase
MSPQIVFIGLGNMGGRMARRLLSLGNMVVGYDVDPDAVSTFVLAGGRAAASPADAARNADIVICSLPAPSVVIDVLCGSDGAFASMRQGSTVIDMSTTNPATAERLAKDASSQGIRFLDAPVSRGVAAAESGTLAIMVGGEEEALEKVKPTLDQLGTDVIHVGPVGTGEMAKLCNNMMAAIIMQGLAEVLVAGTRLGLEPSILIDVISKSSGGSWILSNYLPRTILSGSVAPLFSLDLMHKDISLFLDTANSNELAAPLSALCVQTNRLAKLQGYGSSDYSSIITFFETSAGVSVARTIEEPVEVS